jgi:hypothetical protein
MRAALAQSWIVCDDDGLFQRRSWLNVSIRMRRIGARLHRLLNNDDRGGLINRLSVQDLRPETLSVETLLSVGVGRQADAATNEGHQSGQKCDPSHE